MGLQSQSFKVIQGHGIDIIQKPVCDSLLVLHCKLSFLRYGYMLVENTLCPKKVSPWMFDNNFGKCGPIFKFFRQMIHKKILYEQATPQIFPSYLQYVATLPC